MEATEIWSTFGMFVGGLALAIAAYWGKKVPPSPPVTTSPVLASVGLELGNRDQVERMINELKRIADALQSLSDHRQEDMKDVMEELLERMREAERNRGTQNGRPR